MIYFRHSNIEILRLALETQSVPLENVELSENIINPFSDEQDQAKILLQKIEEFYSTPQSTLTLSTDDVLFLIESVKNLIEIDQILLQSERKSKRIKYIENEIRSSVACISVLEKFLVFSESPN